MSSIKLKLNNHLTLGELKDWTKGWSRDTPLFIVNEDDDIKSTIRSLIKTDKGIVGITEGMNWHYDAFPAFIADMLEEAEGGACIERYEIASDLIAMGATESNLPDAAYEKYGEVIDLHCKESIPVAWKCKFAPYHGTAVIIYKYSDNSYYFLYDGEKIYIQDYEENVYNLGDEVYINDEVFVYIKGILMEE